MIAETIPQLSSLSRDQKMILAAELWRDAVESETEPPNPELVALLKERLEEYRQNPTDVFTWEEVRARVLSKAKK